MTTPQLPDTLEIFCHADDRPRSDLLVMVTLTMSQKNPFHLIFGPTDSAGKLVVVKAQLELGMTSTAEVFPSDYAGPAAFAGEIHVGPLGLPQIQAALRAHDMYQAVVAYPTDYRTMLKNAWESLYQHGAKRIEIRKVLVLPAQNQCQIHMQSLNLAA